MVAKRFLLAARIDSDDPSGVRSVLEGWCRKGGSVRAVPGGFEVTAEVPGESARVLNRRLLSELRRLERRTRLRSEWTCDEITQRFFDYVPKGVRRAVEKGSVP